MKLKAAGVIEPDFKIKEGKFKKKKESGEPESPLKVKNLASIDGDDDISPLKHAKS